MKHFKKSIFTATLLASFILGQPVLAGERGINDGYSGNASTYIPGKSTLSLEEHHTIQKAVHEIGPRASWDVTFANPAPIRKVNYLKTESELVELQGELFPDVNH